MNKKVTMTNKEALNLNRIMQGLRDKGKISFKYFISKNIKTLIDLLSPLEELNRSNRKIREDFDKELRDTVLIPLAKKDSMGNPIIGNDGILYADIRDELKIKKEEEIKENGEISKELDERIKEDLRTNELTIKALIRDLEEKHKDSLSEFEEKDTELAKILDETLDIQLRNIKFTDIPDDTPSAVIEMFIKYGLLEE